MCLRGSIVHLPCALITRRRGNVQGQTERTIEQLEAILRSRVGKAPAAGGNLRDPDRAGELYALDHSYRAAQPGAALIGIVEASRPVLRQSVVTCPGLDGHLGRLERRPGYATAQKAARDRRPLQPNSTMRQDIRGWARGIAYLRSLKWDVRRRI